MIMHSFTDYLYKNKSLTHKNERFILKLIKYCLKGLILYTYFLTIDYLSFLSSIKEAKNINTYEKYKYTNKL